MLSNSLINESFCIQTDSVNSNEFSSNKSGEHDSDTVSDLVQSEGYITISGK